MNAEEDLTAAKTLLQTGQYRAAANRFYYCAFHCMRSILALENVDFKKHSAVISHFAKNYIKTGIFDKKLSKIVSLLSNLRQESDYGDYIDITNDDVARQLESVEYFFEQVKSYLDKQP